MRPPSTTATEALGRIHRYVRRYALEHRETKQLGPFLATFGVHSTGPYLNYALPDERAAPSQSEIEQLQDLYWDRGLTPRVELVRALAPDADDALLAAGFTSEGTFPLMVSTEDSIVDVRRPKGVSIVVAQTRSDFRRLLEARREVFREADRVAGADVSRARHASDRGAIACIAVDSVTSQVVGSGACLVPYDGVTELTSIGVMEEWRRRGIGGLISSVLTQEALQSGTDLVYLTAAHDEGARLYCRVGYSLVGDSHHLGCHHFD